MTFKCRGCLKRLGGRPYGDGICRECFAVYGRICQVYIDKGDSP